MHSKLVIYSLPLLFVIGLTGCGETGLATGSNNTSSQTATVYISSVPSSAQIYINNASQGYTPRVFNKITPGMYSLKLTKSGYQDYVTTRNISAGVYNFSFTLIPLPQISTGNLHITSTPSAAAVYVDSLSKGNTPKTIYNLTAGSHVLMVKKTGYQTSISTGSITAGSTTNVSILLKSIANQTGSLFVTSTPSQATVYVDSVTRGLSPLNITGLSAGGHIVQLTKSGYKAYLENVTINAGSNVLNVSLTKLSNSTV